MQLKINKVDKIIIHCSATREGAEFTAADIRRWHKAQGWQDIGYHYVIRIDGTIEAGRPEHMQGAHCKGHNKSSIGVCYIGGIASDGKTAKDTRTEAQKASLLKLVRELKMRYPSATVHGHNEFAAKACPSFDVRKWLAENGL